MDSRAQTTEINALTELLQDDDPQIKAAVRNRFLALGDAGLAALRSSACDSDAALRVRARAALWFVESEAVFRRLVAQLEEPDFDLEGALVSLAKMERPELEAESVARQLDDLAAEVASEVAKADSPLARARALARVLGEDLGFGGRSEEASTAWNSSIDHVLERRLGLPISLGAIYLLVGRRAGLKVKGVGMPHHFLVAVEEPSDRYFLDPFHGGRFLSIEGCRALLAQFNHSFRPDYLRTVSDIHLFRRVVANLVRSYLVLEDHLRLSRLYFLVNLLQDRET